MGKKRQRKCSLKCARLHQLKHIPQRSELYKTMIEPIYELWKEVKDMTLNFNLFNTNNPLMSSLMTGVLNTLTDLIYIMKFEDNKFTYVFANTSGLSMIDEELVGKSINDVLPQERAELLHYFIKKSVDKNCDVTFTEKIYADHDHQYVYESTLTPIHNDGEVYVISVSRDITAQTQQMKELSRVKNLLEKSKQQFATLIEHHDDAIFALDTDGYYLDSNSASEEIMGYVPFDLIGTSFAQILSKNEIPKVKEIFQRVINGETIQYETVGIHKNGQEVHLSVKNFPMTMDGKVIGVYGIAKEITKEKELLQTFYVDIDSTDNEFEDRLHSQAFSKFYRDSDAQNDEFLQFIQLLEEDELFIDSEDEPLNESNRIYEQIRNGIDWNRLSNDSRNIDDLFNLNQEMTITFLDRRKFTKYDEL
ncbi:PAS domain S-box protein [Lysinibacillus antri]|uniref:PAS domain S-box protein n=2 Tax=Lysinibacillus antri TaxID=2498145 RepID=A0A432L9Z2_9BACI|nr:PAS domain S-box protein [Lysinibacillus antri]